MGFESARIRRIPETEVPNQQTKESRSKGEAARFHEEKEVSGTGKFVAVKTARHINGASRQKHARHQTLDLIWRGTEFVERTAPGVIRQGLF